MGWGRRAEAVALGLTILIPLRACPNSDSTQIQEGDAMEGVARVNAEVCAIAPKQRRALDLPG